MLRLSLLTMFVAALSLYAFKDWFKSLCGLILLTAVVQHPDMPKTMLGIQGLNPWNILLLFVGIGWISAISKERMTWDMPKNITWLLVLYFLIICIAFIRLETDFSRLVQWDMALGGDPPTRLSLLSEHIINCFKWVAPGFLLFMGCNSESRFRMALMAVIGVYFLLAIQVIRWMPLGTLVSGDALTERSLKILSNEVGFHRVNLSMMLAGGSWAFFAVKVLSRSKFQTLASMGGAVLILFGQALTGGRTGYATWLLIGMLLAWSRWKRYIFVAPVLVAIIIATVPAVKERFTAGFSEDTIDTNSKLEETAVMEGGPHWYTVTAGRSIAWPYVFEKIGERPLTGYGREGMKTSGTAIFLAAEFAELFPHPHNAYLEWTLDNGFFALLIVLSFYWLVFRNSYRLFKDSRNQIYVGIGGVCLSLVAALLIGAIGSQTFYPREGSLGMWCAIGLMFRVFVQRKKLLERASLSETPVEHNMKELWYKEPPITAARRRAMAT
ncbi:MAG: O-antigen ligase family protein [Pseudomonadota bacterium]